MRTLPLASALLLLCAVPLRAEEPTPLTFGDAVTAARGRNESLLAARTEVREREKEREAARALYFPTVSFAPIYTHLDDEIQLDLNPIRDVMLKLHPQVPAAMVPPFQETLFKQDMLRLPLAAQWPIFTGGRIRAANHAAAARVRDAEAGTRLTEEGVLRALVRAYFGLRLALEEKTVRAEVLAGLDRHVRDARRLEEEGLIAQVERLNAEVARAEADRQWKRAGHDVEIARAGLANVLAADVAPGDPVTPLFVLGELPPLQHFREAALASHPALARLSAQRDLAREAVAAQKGSFLPEVFAYGLYELRKTDLSPIEPEWVAGVGARFELFDGGSRWKKLGAARAQQDRVALVDQKLRRDLGTLVEKQYREAEKAREQYAALEATRTLADENLRARSRAFEEGLGTSLEVVDARLAQEKVRLERLAAAYSYVNALAELLEASGQGDRFEEMRTRESRIEVQP
jgi:outer membrane protein TolC